MCGRPDRTGGQRGQLQNWVALGSSLTWAGRLAGGGGAAPRAPCLHRAPCNLPAVLFLLEVPLSLMPPALVPVGTRFPFLRPGKAVSPEETWRAVLALCWPSAHPGCTDGPQPGGCVGTPEAAVSVPAGGPRARPGDSAFLPGRATTLAGHEGCDSGSCPHPRVP